MDDNADTRLLLQRAFNDDCGVPFAPGVNEALDAVADDPFDLLLLNLNRAMRQGVVELLPEDGSRDGLGDIPAIALTAVATPRDRGNLLAQGFNAYVGNNPPRRAHEDHRRPFRTRRVGKGPAFRMLTLGSIINGHG